IAGAPPSQRPERQRDQRRQALDAAGAALAPPIGEGPGFGFELFLQYPLSQPARQQEPVAGHEPSGTSEGAVCRDVIASRDAVALEEDAVTALRRQDGAVADFGEAEAVVGMPDVAEAAGEPRLPGVDQTPGLFRRAVIGDQHVEIGIALPNERAQ